MSPRFCCFLLLVVFSMGLLIPSTNAFGVIKPPFEVSHDQSTCVEQLSEFAKSFCTFPSQKECKKEFQETISNACRIQVYENDLMTACCDF